MKILSVVTFLVMVSGCHAQAPHVDCDRQLEPINASADLVQAPAATSAITP